MTLFLNSCRSSLSAVLSEYFGHISKGSPVGCARFTVIAAMAFAALGAMTVSIVQSQIYLLASLSFIGIRSGLSMPPLVAGVSLVCGQRKERAVSIVNAGTGAGIVAASFTALQFTDSWRECFLVFALVSAALSLAALFAARNGNAHRRARTPEEIR